MTEDFPPPTPLEASARELGADTTRYAVDYLMLPMRDGVRLATIVVRPTADGRHPALLMRSPYPLTSLEGSSGLFKALFEKDYAVILQNERGSEWSEGEFGLLTGTTADGQDTLDWIARQEWSNGRAGMYGCSSTAENQLKLAAIGHPVLRACVPMSSGAGIGDVPGAEGTRGQFQQHHPDQYLIMAPTGHCRMTRTAKDAKLGDRPVGDTTFAYDEVFTAWFDRWLRDDADAGAWEPMPKVRVFLMGAGTWLTGEAWPLPDTAERSLYRGSDQGAATLWGDGALLPGPGAAGTDEFRADPRNPVPSIGGDLGTGGPVCADQRPAECRADVLVYSTRVLGQPVSVVGDVRADLYISADVPDADVFVKLVDVYPDGTAYNLAETALRLRYRDGLENPVNLVTGEVYHVALRGITTANYFAPGHQIRVEVAGSSFPNADRNWHTSGRNDLASDGPVAHLTLHHGGDHPSRIVVREYLGLVEPKIAD
jgi:predicted acyl esterase